MKIRKLYSLAFALLAMLSWLGKGMAQSQDALQQLMRERGEYYFTLKVSEPTEIQTLSRLCSIDGTDGRLVVAYANQQEYDKLLEAGYQPNLQTPPSLLEEAKMWDGNRATYEWDSYPTYSQYQSMMEAYPASAIEGRSCTYMELGTLPSNRKIMGVRINNGNPEGKPKFLYSSTIHGDETTGWILMLRLIDELCTSTDSRIVNLVNNLDIFIFPNTNPDGTYYGGNNTVTGARRANANGIDMNRNYPDPHSSAHPDGNAYQTETQWFMQLAEDYAFTMAANYHGGAEVVNYPWDNTSTRHADDAWWQYVSREYASLCQSVHSSYMTDQNNGITNGADWYTIGGGRQDYMNGYRQCREVTVECSTTKNPSASTLPNYWNYNHNAMLAYMEQCLNGVHGFVYDANTHQPIDGATITVLNHDDQYSIISSQSAGDFHRPIKGGTWTLKVSKSGYHPRTVNVTVADDQSVNLTVYLRPYVANEKEYYEQTMPAAAGDYVMGYLNGSTLVLPSHNNSSTVTTTSLGVTATDKGFSVDAGTNVPQVTLTAYGNNGQYYIRYNNRYLARSNSTNVTWSANTSSSGRWHINSNGVYVTYNNNNYYLYYNNGFKLSTTPQNSITFYVGPMFTFTKEIEGYAGASDRYYLIASPIGEVNPEEVTYMLSNDYDLYYFDQAQDQEWRNYEASAFNLVSGKGYLYANSEDVALTFTGFPYNGNGEVVLTKADDTEFEGWNLVGNPFDITAYVDREFYMMNEYGTEIIAGDGNGVEAMEGIFVVAETNSETMTFSTEEPSRSPSLVMNVSRDRGSIIDRAIVRFGDGGTLPKFQMNPNHTKVYIPMDGEDYAVASVSAGRDAMHGVSTEIPVNFKASENGTYTLSVNIENVEFSYLHLIDNLTGADVDLLAAKVPELVEGPTLHDGVSTGSTTSYTFDAKTTDYPSRFRLVFSASVPEPVEAPNQPFAYLSHGDIIVNGTGTLQVIDMLGRIVVCRDANYRVSTNGFVPGVYVIRLIDGENVKTQKIVVR